MKRVDPGHEVHAAWPGTLRRKARHRCARSAITSRSWWEACRILERFPQDHGQRQEDPRRDEQSDRDNPRLTERTL